MQNGAAQSTPRGLGPANRDRRRMREPLPAQLASFVDLFVWLMVLKSFFIPLFVIPTGSMAETLMGAHATATCQNCGFDYLVGPIPAGNRAVLPPHAVCPNCAWAMTNASGAQGDVQLKEKIGDRIVVHGWNYELGGMFGPQRFDVVVFKNPNQPYENYIKRLVGLPGETIRLLDGDVFVSTETDPTPLIVSKPPLAQKELWRPFYDHNHPPQRPSNAIGDYMPRWVAVDPQSAWSRLDQREIVFDGLQAGRQAIQFVTQTTGDLEPGLIRDVYGYNGAQQKVTFPVNDVRLGLDVRALEGDGALELIVARSAGARFFARLAGGQLTLEADTGADGPRRTLQGPVAVPAPTAGRPLRLALGHADGVVTVEVDGRRVLQSTRDQYTITVDEALAAESQQARFQRRPPRVRIAAGGLRARLANVRIDRDVFYQSISIVNSAGEVGFVPQGSAQSPLTLGDAYFVMGDNSPSSLDGRLWTPDILSANLRDDYERGEYSIGTVPADHLIGRAFLVYWPGFLHAWEGELSVVPPINMLTQMLRSGQFVPDIGRIRWIH